MKKLIFVFLIIVFVVTVSAQERTLISDKYESGGFGSIVLKVTKINGESAMLVGGRGNWIIDHSFVFGGGGYGLVTNVPANAHNTFYGSTNLKMGYGGVDFGYILLSNDLIHFSSALLVGAGSVSDKFGHEAFFVLEPNVQANLNVTHFFRIAAGVGYRYVSGVKSIIVTSADLSGLSVNAAFEFGIF